MITATHAANAHGTNAATIPLNVFSPGISTDVPPSNGSANHDEPCAPPLHLPLPCPCEDRPLRPFTYYWRLEMVT